MPYIKQEDRAKFNILNSIEKIETKGELEYCIYRLMVKYMDGKEFKYSVLHDCTYASQHCADEFRRRFLDKREDKAREENGDIFNITV